MAKEKKIRVLFVPSGSRISPATRYRVHQIIPFLEGRGFDCEVYSIFSERMTSRMIRSSSFNKVQRAAHYLQLVTERFFRAWKIIFLAGRADVVFLQRATFPFGMERLLRARNKNIIFDIDDSIYLPDRKEAGLMGQIKRYIKKKEVISVLRVARCVIAENSYIKSFVRDYCKKVYIIMGPIDTVKNNAKAHGDPRGKITIGWIGSLSTALYLSMLDGPIRQLAGKYSIKLRLIGAGPYSIEGVEVESTDWRESDEVSELHRCDIGVMPMPDNEWTRGKLGCKTVQYMANAIPSVLSYTVTTAEVVEDGINGFLAATEGEWVRKLSLLIENPELRKKMGIAGRRTAEQRFSMEANGPRYIEIFMDCLNDRQ